MVRIEILDDEHHGLVGTVSWYREAVKKTVWGQWSTVVGRGRDMLCPPPSTAQAVAHFARRNTRSMLDAEMVVVVGCSDNGDAHRSIVMATNFKAGFLPLLGEHGGQFPQQHLCFFTWETIRRHRKRRKVPALLKEASQLFRPIGLGINIRNPNVDDAVLASCPKAANQCHQGQFPQQELRFFTWETIRRHRKRRKVLPALLEEASQLFRPIGLGINIRNPDVDDAVLASCPKAVNQCHQGPHRDCCKKAVSLSSPCFLCLISIPAGCNRCRFWDCHKLGMGRGPWKEGCSVHLGSHCDVR
jgi:hypothetical protein